MSENALPDSVQIGPHRYAIRREKRMTDEHGNERWGECRHAQHEIAVLRDAPPSQATETLFHEILHAIANTYFIVLNEEDVHRMSVGIVDTLKRNPDLTRLYLVD